MDRISWFRRGNFVLRRTTTDLDGGPGFTDERFDIDEARWVPTTLIVDYMHGHDDDVSQITVAEARLLLPF